MTGNVVSLAIHRQNQSQACECPRHRLEALTYRAVEELAGTEGQLLVDRGFVAALVDDLVTTVRDALASPHGRTNP
jgi:hypothetical protein